MTKDATTGDLTPTPVAVEAWTETLRGFSHAGALVYAHRSTKGTVAELIEQHARQQRHKANCPTCDLLRSLATVYAAVDRRLKE